MTTGQPREPWWVARLRKIRRWVDVADWRSWVAHALIAVPIFLITAGEFWILKYFHIYTPWLAAAIAVINLYKVRELEQLAHELMGRWPPNYVDHVVDILAPAFVCVGLALYWSSF